MFLEKNKNKAPVQTTQATGSEKISKLGCSQTKKTGLVS